MKNTYLKVEMLLRPGWILGVAQLGVLLMVPVLGYASPISGNLVLTGNGTQETGLSLLNIDQDYLGTASGNPPIGSIPADGGDDDGKFNIGSSSTGSFAPLIGVLATVHDLNFSADPVGSTTGSGLPLTNFVTFAGSSLTLTLTELLPGAFSSASCGGAPAQGQTCTPAGSPYNLSNIAGGEATLSFSFLGTASDGIPADTTNFSGSFSDTFSGTNLQAIATALENNQTIVSGLTGSVTATTPEPASISMMLIGGMLIAGFVIYRRRNAVSIS